MAERVFTMPDLGEGLEEGRIVRWLVAEGAWVELNQPLVEVETAKAIVEIPSPFAGRIQALHGSDGEDVFVGSPLVTFEVEGGLVAPIAESWTSYPPTPQVSATPPVRKLAKELGVDIGTVRGTGRDGRVTEDDVRSASGGPADVTRIELTPVRRAIAANLERQVTIPQVTTFRTVDCSALQTFRTELGVSPLPVVVAALCRVANDHPLINARWSADAILAANGVNVGLAIDTEKGSSWRSFGTRTRSGSPSSRRKARGWPGLHAPAPSLPTTSPVRRSRSPTPAPTGAKRGPRSSRRVRASRSRSA